jgi:Zn-dependent peptidase ImmA (M78 family)/DNA-binding XRE family transcriptional regulator
MDGERIKLARKRAGLSLRDLAAKMGGTVSAQAIGKYERGEMLPGSTVLIAMTKALGVSIPYLLAPQGVELQEVEFRAKASTGEKERARAKAEVIEWVERYLQIEEILGLNSAAWKCPIKSRQSIQNALQAERLAEKVREEWNLGTDPIPNMTELLEENGIKVLVIELPEKMSGLTCFAYRTGHREPVPVIVVNRCLTLERRRITLAHELAHRVIDSQSGDAKQLESWCNRFAGALLAPQAHLEKEIGERRSAFGYQELIELKRLYGISAAAFLMRLEQIGVIDQGAKEYAFRTYASGWRSAEPAPLESPDERGQLERPNRFERLVFRALAEEMIGLPKAAELLRVTVEQVEALMQGPA